MTLHHVTEDDLKALLANRDRANKTVGINNEVAPRLQSVAPVAGPHFRSKWEYAYASKLELEKRAGLIRQYWYEPFSLWLPGKVRFKPDFLVDALEALYIIEVKGWSKNRRDGMTRLKIAAALFPCFTWTLVRKTKDGWDEERV